MTDLIQAWEELMKQNPGIKMVRAQKYWCSEWNGWGEVNSEGKLVPSPPIIPIK